MKFQRESARGESFDSLPSGLPSQRPRGEFRTPWNPRIPLSKAQEHLREGVISRLRPFVQRPPSFVPRAHCAATARVLRLSSPVSFLPVASRKCALRSKRTYLSPLAHGHRANSVSGFFKTLGRVQRGARRPLSGAFSLAWQREMVFWPQQAALPPAPSPPRGQPPSPTAAGSPVPAPWASKKGAPVVALLLQH